MSKELYLIHGKPGSGKTTASKLAASKVGDSYHFAIGDKKILTDEGRSLRQELASAIYKFAETAASAAGVRCETIGDATEQKGLAMRALLMTAQLDDRLH